MADPPAGGAGPPSPAARVRVRAAVPRPGGADRFVGGVALAQTVSWGVLYYAFSVLLVPMERTLGWSRTLLVGGFTAAVVISGLLAPAVGRRLDDGSPRVVMTAGSVVGTLVVVGWARADSVTAYYAAWAGIGVAMALVLYEPAFTVVAKRYAPDHHRALTTVTLIAGTSSFVFQPLTSTLATAHGWRTTVLILAAILGTVTIPLHVALLPRRDGGAGHPPRARGTRRTSAAGALADGRLWTLTAAFAGSAVTSFGTSVLLVAYLVDHGWALGSAALAGGTLGLMQLVGRLAFGPLRARLSPRALARLVLGLPGVGVALLVTSGGTALVWPAVVVLGASQGVTTLLRATLMVDLYGLRRIGALNGLSATPVVLARALAPLAAASLMSLTGGYSVPFLLLASVAALSAAGAGRTLGGHQATPRPPEAAPQAGA